jgi:hypothetical protein
VFVCDQVKSKTLYTYCEQVGRRGKDYETKLSTRPKGKSFLLKHVNCIIRHVLKQTLRKQVVPNSVIDVII